MVEELLLARMVEKILVEWNSLYVELLEVLVVYVYVLFVYVSYSPSVLLILLLCHDLFRVYKPSLYGGENA